MHLGIWACGSTWRRHTGKHGSSAPHQRITQPTSWPHVASPTWSSTEQLARPATKQFHPSNWRALEACCRPWTWWCNDATALAGYATVMMMMYKDREVNRPVYSAPPCIMRERGMYEINWRGGLNRAESTVSGKRLNTERRQVLHSRHTTYQLAAIILTAKSRIAAAIYQTTLSISTTSGILSILHNGSVRVATTNTRLMALFPEQPVASAGPYASLHLTADRQPWQQPTTEFLQAECPSCHPTNSVKALKDSG